MPISNAARTWSMAGWPVSRFTGEFSNITSALDCLMTDKESFTGSIERAETDCPDSTSDSAFGASSPFGLTANPCLPVAMPVIEYVMSNCSFSVARFLSSNSINARATLPKPMKASL